MKRSIESMLRFVNLSAAGILAGSLGFGEAALVPGWEAERSHFRTPRGQEPPIKAFNAIGPVALASSMTLAIGSKDAAWRRSFDVLSTLGLAGVLAATVLVTVPLSKQLDLQVPTDYPSAESHSLARNWSVANSVRRALGIGAFFCAVVSSLSDSRR